MTTKKQINALAKRIVKRDITAVREAYAIFNKDYFGGKLPADLKINWKSIKNTGGQLYVTWNLATDEAKIAHYRGGKRAVSALSHKEPHKHLTIAKSHMIINPDYTTKTDELPLFFSTLLHEMIHAEQIFVLGVYADHCLDFDIRLMKLELAFLKKYHTAIKLAS